MAFYRLDLSMQLGLMQQTEWKCTMLSLLEGKEQETLFLLIVEMPENLLIYGW